jgi:hypothetical protein
MSRHHAKYNAKENKSHLLDGGDDMKRTVWLSFDINLGGDFDGMFEWLDEHEAEECGDNLAIVRIECREADTVRFLKKSLTRDIEFSEKDRVYAIAKRVDGGFRGGFIIGKRRTAPWRGASTLDSPDDEG